MTQNNPQQAVFEPAYDTEYRRIVNPDRVVVMPGYSLRLLAHGDLTPRELSLWLAFRQAVYAKGQTAEAVTANIPHQWLLPFAMMSRAVYWREVGGQDSFCGGLIVLVPPQDTGEASRQVANANRYQVSMYPRLTRRDIGIIQDILARAAGEGEGAEQRLEDKLRNLLDLNPGAYLDDPRATPAQVNGWPRTLGEVIRRILSGNASADLVKLANRLQERILAGYGKLIIPHYFLRTVVPQFEMTQAQAWTVIALRYRTWFDYTNGERWPFAIVHGGLGEVAAMTGSSVKSVKRWLVEPGFNSLVSIADTSGVNLPEFWQAETAIFNVSLLEPVGDALDKTRLDQGQSETRLWTKRDSVRDKMRLGSGQNETPLNRFISVINRHHRAKMQEPVGQNWTHPVDDDFDPRDNLPFIASESAAAGGDFSEKQVAPEDWTLDDLIRTNTVSSKKANEMRRASVSGQVFAAWIAEAFSRQGIERPIALAVVSSLDHPTGAPGIYAELFARPRVEVLELLAQSIAGYPITESVIRKFSTERRRALYLALGGKESDIPARYVPPVRPAAPKSAEPEAPTPVEIPEHVRAQAAALKARLKAGK